MSRPFPSRNFSTPNAFVRVNGKIRARDVRIIGTSGQQLGVFPLGEAINMARAQNVDLVEIAPNAAPPVCRLVDYGKFRYEQSKKEKEARKHQHANKVKEVQLSPTIDPHDFSVKLSHAIDFLCEDMKVKVTLRFRGREMAHQEYGFQVVSKFIKEVAVYGHPDSDPKLIGRGITLMISPLPRNKRGKNPRQGEVSNAGDVSSGNVEDFPTPLKPPAKILPVEKAAKAAPHPVAEKAAAGFANNPFAQLDSKLKDLSAS